jgi:hypothetical protein
VLPVDVQSQLDHRGNYGVALHGILCCVVHVMYGLMVRFHTPERVPVLHALVNPSWHLTAWTLSGSRKGVRFALHSGCRGSAFGR